MIRAFLILFGIGSFQAFAYIDPGIIGGLYQVLYALFMGFVGMFIFKPWRVIKAFFDRRKK
jgi:hypothetical protein